MHFGNGGKVMKINKRGVEALPLKYIIIALVAALVIGIALQFVGILKGGTLNAANQMNESVTEQTTCALDNAKPTITSIGTITCNSTTDVVTVANAAVSDNCGIDWVYVELKNSSAVYKGLGSLSESTDKWSGTLNFTSASNPGILQTYNIASGDTVVIWVKDTANQPNYGVNETGIQCLQ